jgi:UDP-arabinose 4-epimerase
MPKTVFVTGGAGYVGSHCCKAFSNAGWNVVVYDNLSRGWEDFVKWGPLIKGDILDVDKLTQEMRRVRPDAVVHFAALAYVGESVSCPEDYYRTNTMGALNVLSAMRKNSVEKIVFSSTCATYGIPNRSPIDESHAQRPINPYGWSKLFVEQILADHEHAYAIRHVILRYFNAAGADPEYDIGERHEPETHVIPLAIFAAQRKTKGFKLFGTDYETHDGSAVRDFIHVTDLAMAHLYALDHLQKYNKSDVFNLGTGNGTSVLEVIDAVSKIAETKVAVIPEPRRPGDPAILVADSQKARQLLGWEPQNSKIQKIVEDAWFWHMKSQI